MDIREFARMVGKGIKPEVAAELCGLPRRVFLRRMKAGEIDVENGADDTQDAMLWKAVQNAKSDYVITCQNALNSKIMDGDFKSIQFALESFMPSDYGSGKGKDDAELEPIQVIEGEAMSVSHAELPEPQIAEISGEYVAISKKA